MRRHHAECYMICSAPRAGSHYLAYLLSATGVAGNPDDYFNPHGAGSSMGTNGGAFQYDRRFVDKLIAETSTQNGVLGTMAQFNQIANYVGFLTVESIFPTKPEYIFLEREDVVRQAVSLAIARQTGQFLDGDPVAGGATFNPEQIRCCQEDILNHVRGWKTFFRERGANPYSILYEDLVSYPLNSVRGILKRLGLSLPRGFAIPDPPFKKQATAINEEWVRRYKNSGYFE